MATKKRNFSETEGTNASRDVESDSEEFPSLNISDDSEVEGEKNADDVSDAESIASVPSLEGVNSSDLEELSSDNESLKLTDEEDNIEYVRGADGKLRPIYPEIEPYYSSDDSDREDINPIGNIPITAYDKFPHIGYNIDGKRIMRPATKSAIDAMLESIELPKGWTGLVDKNTGENLNLSKEEMDLIERVQKGMLPNDNINPFEDQLEWFSNTNPEIMPLSSRNEPKRRFVQSKHEAKQVMKLVRAIREGKLSLKPKDDTIDDDDRQMMLSKKLYDVWEKEEAVVNRMHLQAPKLPPPTHEESYNPPKEYLFTEEEKAKWEATDPEDRETNFIPQAFGALRKVPGYANALRERFERCLDLYLAPRARNKRVNIDPDSLIPDLPSPDELRPFPIRCSTTYIGHEGRVRTLSIDSTGEYLATGGEDGTVRVWDVLTGRELWKLDLLKEDTYLSEQASLESANHNSTDHIDQVQWHPKTLLLTVAAGDNIYLLVPSVLQSIEVENEAHDMIEKGWTYHAANLKNIESKVNVDDANLDEDNEDEAKAKRKQYAEWTKPPARLLSKGCNIVIRCTKRVKHVNWHSRGDYFVSTQPDGQNASVLVHQLSKHSTQCPFKKSKGLIQNAKFHPYKPHLYVASQRYVRIYNLANQSLLKKLLPGVKWLSNFDIHPQGDNVITSSYDLRVTWHDLELSDRPYKTLRYHDRAVRDVKFHPKLPLFCSGSDDGTVNVLHDTVYDDTLKNPLLVPLKILKGHKITGGLGVIEVAWHPREAWLFTAGGDGTARLWTT